MAEILAEAITVEADGGKFTGFLAQSRPSAPRVLVYHPWWGLTSSTIDLARRLADEGFNAFAPDLYDGKTAATVEEAMTMLQNRDFERHQFIAAAAVEWMQAQPSRAGGLGLIGLSMGGSWSIALAGVFPEAVKAVVLFYADGDTDWAKVRARFQGHYASHDEWVSPAERQAVEDGLTAHGIPYEFYTYLDTEHWFCEPDRPEYRPEPAALAWERTVRFLKAELQAGS